MDGPETVRGETADETVVARVDSVLAWSSAEDDSSANEDGDQYDKSRWKVAALAFAIVLVCAAATIAVMWLGHRHSDQVRTRPESGAQSSPGPLNGTFRLDFYRGQAVVHRPNGQLKSPGEPYSTVQTEWWALTSSCVGGSCTATGVQLDDDLHQRPAVNTSRYVSDEFTHTLKLVNGQWVSARPNSAQQPCDGTSDRADTWQFSWTLTPLPDGTLKGEEVDRVISDDCFEIGVVTNTPIAATRVGGAPPAVTSHQ